MISSSTAATTANPAIAEAARAFGKAPDALLGGIHKATEALLATRADAALGPSRSQHGVEGVALREPSANTIQAEAEKGLSAKAALLKLLAELQAVLSDVSLSSLMNKLKNHLMRIESQGSQLAQLGADLEAALAAQDAAAQAATEATGMAEAAEAEARMAREEVQRLRQELAAVSPGSPEHDALTANLKAAEGHAAALQANAMEALASAANAVDHLNGIQEQVQQLQSQVRAGVAGNEDHISRTQSTIFRKTEALTKLNDLLAELSQEDLTRQSETIQMQLKAAEEANQKRAREYEAEVQKAKDLHEKMGCWGKIIGWVVTVVSVVAAPFTGGASLALAGIGLALAIAEEVTGFSVLGAALSPVIEKVLMPMMQFMANIYAEVIKGVGDLIGVDLDEDAVRLTSMILGAVAAVATIIAVAVVAKGAVGKFMEKFGTEILKNVAKHVGAMMSSAAGKLSAAGGKLVDKVGSEAFNNLVKTISTLMTEVAKSTTKAMARVPTVLSKAFANTNEEAAIRMTYVSDAATVAQAGNQTAQGAGGIAVADMQRKAAEIEGKMMMSFADNRLMRDLMQQAVDTFVATNATVENVRQMISRLFAQHHSTGVFIANQMRA